MDDRLQQLEASIVELRATLRRLEARLAALEAPSATASAQPVGAVAPPAELPGTEPVQLAGLLTLAGRSFLVLGGAFLVRALTDAGTLPRGTGIALGLLYALVWLALADRDGGRGSLMSAAFHGAMTAAIAYPLVWEAATRFDVLSGTASAATIALVTALMLAVAWRERLHLVAWFATTGAVFASLALLRSTHALEALTAVLLTLGIATVWISYERRWLGLRWLPAVVANFAVWLMTSLLAQKGGPPEGYREMTIDVVLPLALALPVAYLASFAVRTLVRGRDVTAFEAAQTAAALYFGFGGGVAVAHAAGAGAIALGAAALVLAIACYGVAFAFVERRPGQARNFVFYASLAIVLVLAGARLVAGPGIDAVLWSVLGLAAAGLGRVFDRATLRVHSALYLAAAALSVGLLATVARAFLSPLEGAWPQLGPGALITLAFATASWATLAAARREGESWLRSLPQLALALLSVLGLGAACVLGLAWLLAAQQDPAALAALRTAVLATAALLLAACARSPALNSLAWMAYPALVAGGLKLLVEDLPHGRPATLFLAFALYGVALIGTPRLLRGDKAG